MPDPIEEFLLSYPEGIRAIAKELRTMAKSTMHGVHEFLYYDAVNYSLNDSPLGRICYISPAETHVTVGLLFGSKLADKNHLLQGTGKRARHFTIHTIGEAKNPALKELVKAAWTHGVDSPQTN